MLTTAIRDVVISVVHNLVVIYSPDDTNVYHSRGGEIEENMLSVGE